MELAALVLYVVVCAVLAWRRGGSQRSALVSLAPDDPGTDCDHSADRCGGTDVLTDSSGLALACGPRALFVGSWGFSNHGDESSDWPESNVWTDPRGLALTYGPHAAFGGPWGFSD